MWSFMWKWLDSKNNTEVYVRNNVINSVIVSSKKKGRKKKKIDGFRRKLGFPECDIMLPSELWIKSKIRKMFVYKINPYFYKNYEKKIW